LEIILRYLYQNVLILFWC